MTRRRIVALGAVLAGLMVAQAAHAQYGAPPPGAPPPPGYYAPPPPTAAPPPGVQRSGLTIGFSLGWGGLSSSDCQDCDSLMGLGLEFHIGGMVTPRLAIMFDGSGVAHQPEGTDLTIVHAVDTVAAQYWVTDQIWIKGGVGFGQLSIQDSQGNRAESDTGAGGLIAAGIEVMQGPTFAIDLQVRGAAATYQDSGGGDSITLTNASILVGANWY